MFVSLRLRANQKALNVRTKTQRPIQNRHAGPDGVRSTTWFSIHLA